MADSGEDDEGEAQGLRKIIHVDMDAFYASVEQRDDPQLRGRPVVVAWRGQRSVVCAASYEARRYGIRSAMPAVRVERLCPDAVFVAPDFNRYRAVSRAVREIMLRHTDLVEPLSLDEAYLDVTDNKTGLPTATRVAKAIREQIRTELSLTASAGVAPNKFLAKIASDWNKPDGLFVIRPEEVDAFMPTLPVTRLPGVGKVTGERLAAIGVATCGDLQRVPLAELEDETVRWCKTIMKRSPLALRMLKSAFNAELDGQAGIQELAGNATLLYYFTEEAQEGKNAFLEKRDPDFKKYPKFP